METDLHSHKGDVGVLCEDPKSLSVWQVHNKLSFNPRLFDIRGVKVLLLQNHLQTLRFCRRVNIRGHNFGVGGAAKGFLQRVRRGVSFLARGAACQHDRVRLNEVSKGANDESGGGGERGGVFKNTVVLWAVDLVSTLRAHPLSEEVASREEAPAERELFK